jgi:transposase
MRSVEGKFSTDFKAKVALAALKGDKSLLELEKEFAVPSDQIQEWLQQLEANICLVFEQDTDVNQATSLISKTNHAKIGELIAENDFLTKVLGR